jgi:hypothetical protein
MLFDFHFVPPMPYRRRAAYRNVERAFRDLQHCVDGLQWNQAKTDENSAILAGKLRAFWIALGDAQQALDTADPQFLAKTVMDMSRQHSLAHHAKELLGAGAGVFEVTWRDKIQTEQIKQHVQHHLDYYHRVGDEVLIWHHVQRHLREYGEALLEALRGCSKRPHAARLSL